MAIEPTEMALISQLNDYVGILCEEEHYDALEGHWLFRSGGSCCCCTDAAAKVAKRFGGRVVGYFSHRNPSAFIGVQYGGHDFALIENRFIVDYWAFRMARLTTSPVLDLNTQKDQERARRLYGDARFWETVSIESA